MVPVAFGFARRDVIIMFRTCNVPHIAAGCVAASPNRYKGTMEGDDEKTNIQTDVLRNDYGLDYGWFRLHMVSRTEFSFANLFLVAEHVSSPHIAAVGAASLLIVSDGIMET